MTDVIGTPREFFHRYLFTIEIDGIANTGFSKCSELAAEVATVEHWEGGALIANKSPGRVTVPDITLEQGACNDLELFTWFEQVAKLSAGIAGQGQRSPIFKRNMEIIQRARDGSILQRWKITGAWPKRFSAGEWDNTSDETVITSLVLVIDTFQPMIRPQ